MKTIGYKVVDLKPTFPNEEKYHPNWVSLLGCVGHLVDVDDNYSPSRFTLSFDGVWQNFVFHPDSLQFVSSENIIPELLIDINGSGKDSKDSWVDFEILIRFCKTAVFQDINVLKVINVPEHLEYDVIQYIQNSAKIEEMVNLNHLHTDKFINF